MGSYVIEAMICWNVGRENVQDGKFVRNLDGNGELYSEHIRNVFLSWNLEMFVVFSAPARAVIGRIS